MTLSVSGASRKNVCLWWVSFGQYLNFHPAAFPLSPPQPAEERENRKEKSKKTPGPRSRASCHHKQNRLDLGKINLLRIKIDIKLLIWVGRNETTNIKLIPARHPFPGSPSPRHSRVLYSPTRRCRSLGNGWLHQETVVPLCRSFPLPFFLCSGALSWRAAILQEYLLHHRAPSPSLLVLVFPLLCFTLIYSPPLLMWCFLPF